MNRIVYGLTDVHEGRVVRKVVVNVSHTVFYVLLNVHVGVILVNNQLDAQFFFMYFYLYSLHVLGSYVPIIRKINCINTTSGISHSAQMTVWCAGLHLHTKRSSTQTEIY
jgi:hypothetical protein